MLNLFDAPQPKTKGMCYDLFGEYDPEIKFRWAVARFTADGALIARKYAIKSNLEYFYPWAYNNKSQPYFILPTYIFIEWIPDLTPNICRRTTKFLYFLSQNREPELVARHSINGILEGLRSGIFDKRPKTRIKKAGAPIIIIEGALKGYKATLMEDISDKMPKNHEVMIDIGWYKTKIKISSLEI